MARKRVPAKTKPPVVDSPTSQQGKSDESKHLGSPQMRSPNNQHKNHDDSAFRLTSHARVLFLICLILGLIGVLFFPKIISLVNSVNDVGLTLGFRDVKDIRQQQKVELSPLKTKQNEDDDYDEEVTIMKGDLMEDEEIQKEEPPLDEDNERNNRADTRKTIVSPLQNKADEKNQTKDKNAEKTSSDKKKSASSETGSKIPPRNGRVGPGKPIILNAETDHIVLDPSQMKIIDSPSQKQSEHQNKRNPNSKKQEKETGNEKKNKEKEKQIAGNETIEDEIQNFQSTFHTTFTPKKIFDGGRRIPPVELLAQKPTNSSVKVFLFDDFLSAEECAGLMRAHDSHVKALNKTPILCFDSVETLRSHLKDVKKNIRVTPNDFTPGTKCVNTSFSLQLTAWLKGNWSYSTAFYPGESVFSKVAADRIQKAMGLDPKSGGKFQITSYPIGKAYKEHTDCLLDGKDSRDRVVSVLMYLNDVDDGGETRFPELGIWVKPKRGRALVWNNMSPEGYCEPHSKHIASVVKKGSKYVLIRWYYYKTFYSLGRRPPAPHLPAREALQAMVMCDVYNSGSCRWYDEWSYEHLLEYERNKLTLI
ncbi:unnamed protein product [Lymnaea stagnalis]|uniref:Fe2OG dioxygenase domain-containing protein n=1 Tax=Lymnaea stagnalis TaxID=6523 RepID=A0AAV2HXE4_LYMST